MSRIRSIHPGFFTDEDLVSVSIAARILFLGLGVEADDKGTFPWKPLTIKMRIFPADNVDVPSLLGELVAAGAVRQYEVDGKKYGGIRNFCKFQRPKKPNDINPATSDILSFCAASSEPEKSDGEEVPDQFPTGGEIAAQMEDGGWRMEDGMVEPSGSTPPIPPAGNSKSKSTKAGKASKVAMTEDWVPAPLPADLAQMADQWPPGRLDAEIAEFREYWIEDGDKRPGWDRTFRVRIRAIHDRVMRESRNARSSNGTGKFAPIDRRDGFERALDRRLGLGPDGGEGPAGRYDAGEGPGGREIAPARAVTVR